MANGDKAFVRFEASATLKDGVPQTAEGKWTYVGGTGKLKGLKGKGTYSAKAKQRARSAISRANTRFPVNERT